MIKRKTVEIGGAKARFRTPSMMAFITMKVQRELMVEILCLPEKDEDGNLTGRYALHPAVDTQINYVTQIAASIEKVDEDFPINIPHINDEMIELLKFYRELENSKELTMWDMEKIVNASEFVCKSPGDPETQPPNPSKG